MNLRQLVERDDRPFATQPQVGRYFPAANIEDARRRLARTIERGSGPGVILGGVGIGKSLLLQVLAAQYREKFDVVLLACSQLCTRRALLQAIHFELGLDYHRRDEGELRLSLLDTLLSSDDATQGLLLLVDEGQALAVHLLEELRLLTNLSRGGSPRVRLVMAGMPALEEKLAGPQLQSFSQRLSARCYLAPLTRTETAQYVRAQLAASHADADRIFAPAAFDSVFTASDGVPRLVNQICDRALEFADERQLEQIDAAVIQAAWADLQQLPTAWEPMQPSADTSLAKSNVVEFGSLSEPSEAVDPPKSHVSLMAPVTEAAPTPAAEAPKVIAPTPAPTKFMPSTSRPTVRRPRVFSQPAPDAVNPFAEEFAEEELVLDSFATLASIFGTRTPRVENGRQPGFSQLVQHALDATDATKREAAPEIAKLEITEIDETESERDRTRAMIRLAIVNDSPAAAVDELPMEFDDEALRQSDATAELVSEPKHAADDTILVIEDEPTPPAPGPQPGVHREGYRQLFSRLRHGT